MSKGEVGRDWDWDPRKGAEEVGLVKILTAADELWPGRG